MHIETTMTLDKLCKTTALIIMLIIGITATISGSLFLIDPSGEKMGMMPDYLKFSPFTTYLVPGIVLLMVNGIFNLVVAGLVLARHRHSSFLIMVQGVLLSGWILVQVLLVRDFNPLHLVMGSFGSLLALCGWYLHRHKH